MKIMLSGRALELPDKALDGAAKAAYENSCANASPMQQPWEELEEIDRARIMRNTAVAIATFLRLWL